MTTEVVFNRIVLTGIPEFRCDVMMTQDGRTLDVGGNPIPHDQRGFECGADGTWLIGMQPVCERHFREACHVMEFDPDEIEAEWRAAL